MENTTLLITTPASSHPELNLAPGRIIALEGPLGSGRTSLVKAILGLKEPGERTIRIAGLDPRTDELETRWMIAYISEELIFPDSLSPSGISNILSLTQPSWKPSVFNDYCTSFGLPLKEPVRGFSPHMKFALMLAAALSRESRLLLIDGAVTRQDEFMQVRLPGLLKEYLADGSRSVLYTCGSVSEGLREITDQILQIRGGKICTYAEETDLATETRGEATCHV